MIVDKKLKNIVIKAVDDITFLTYADNEPLDGDQTEYLAAMFLKKLNKSQGNV